MAQMDVLVELRHDLRPEFWRLILGPQLACSVGLWAPGCQYLAEAQAARLDAICARLRLRPGSLLLDLGCGWGALAIHAAQFHDARVTAVTASSEQAAFIEQRAAELGLRSKVTVLTATVGEISVPRQDAIVAELGLQLGGSDVAAHRARLFDLLRPGGRLLVQQLSRGSRAAGPGPFVDRYIAPGLDMRPVGDTISQLEQVGFEISGVATLRPDLARTVRAWQQQLDEHWDGALAVAGVEPARVWRLCLAGLALAFDEGRMDVHQILAAPRVTSRAAVTRTGVPAAGRAATGPAHTGATRTRPAHADPAAGLAAAGPARTGLAAAGPARTGLAAAGPAHTGATRTGPANAGVAHADPAAGLAPADPGLASVGSARPAGVHAAGIRPADTAHSMLVELVPRPHRPHPRHASGTPA
jgi:cyclopropane fatty-acyl-phospholipid synthase-like methyltransferase